MGKLSARIRVSLLPKPLAAVTFRVRPELVHKAKTFADRASKAVGTT
jgi:hypothetical protein